MGKKKYNSLGRSLDSLVKENAHPSERGNENVLYESTATSSAVPESAATEDVQRFKLHITCGDEGGFVSEKVGGQTKAIDVTVPRILAVFAALPVAILAVGLSIRKIAPELHR